MQKTEEGDGLLVYDENCRICIGFTNVLQKMRVIKARECLSYQASAELKNSIQFDQFKNGVAFRPSGGAEFVYGSQAISILFEKAFPFMKWFFRISFLLLFFEFFYKMIAFNRYVILLPKRSLIECDCYPSKAIFYRFTYVFLAFIIASLVFFISDRALSNDRIATAIYSNNLLLLALILPFLIQLFMVYIFSKKNIYEYAGHLSSVLLLGSLTMLPSVLYASFFSADRDTFLFFNLGIFFFAILYMHQKRIRFIQMSIRWQYFLAILIFAFLLGMKMFYWV